MKQLITILLAISLLFTACNIGNPTKNLSEEKPTSKVDTYMPNSKDKSFKFISDDFEFSIKNSIPILFFRLLMSNSL